MSKKSNSSFQLFSYQEDQPNTARGSLIPGRPSNHPRHTFTPASTRPVARTGIRVTVSLFAFLALFLLGTSGYGLVSQANLASAPTVTIFDSYSNVSNELNYGPQVALSQNGFYIETRDAFIDEGMTFVEIDIVNQQVRFFEKGVLFQSAEILAIGEAGSWWDTPSGLYEIENKEEKMFSKIGQVNLTWQMTFQGNFMIHGQPTDSDGLALADDYPVGGIRLSSESAEELFENVLIGTPVLVHSELADKVDNFVYEPLVVGMDTPHYFIADIDNGTVLAATDLADTAAIASLTKLMTAVVAAETINLDGRLRVTSPTFVTSLIPRLSQRSSVSLYSLMQLLLVESSNEAAETIAGENGRAEFIEAMNAKARQLGMMQTHFTDPSGLDSGNVSSLGDLYRLTKYIYDSRSFIFEITANKKIPNAYIGGEFNGLINFNEVKDMDSFVGGKVGETIAAGKTSISLHKLQFQGETRTLVVIILGSTDRTEDIKTLISYTEKNFNH